MQLVTLFFAAAPAHVAVNGKSGFAIGNQNAEWKLQAPGRLEEGFWRPQRYRQGCENKQRCQLQHREITPARC